MKEPSEESSDWEDQRMKIIGLGESSIRKSYYPELQQRLLELELSNRELLDALEEIQQKEEELRQNYDEHRAVQSALDLARKKLNLLNTLTFQDIQSALFSLCGYLTLTKEAVSDDSVGTYLDKSLLQMQKIERVLHIAKQFQNMGIRPPKWQGVMETYVFAVSHLDFSGYGRDVHLQGLEIFADPLLEDVFFYLLENIPLHSGHATRYVFRYEEHEGGVSLTLQDDGVGIEDERKEVIFERRTGLTGGVGLFLVREILSITDITICENGEPGTGARFEIFFRTECIALKRNKLFFKSGKNSRRYPEFASDLYLVLI